MLSSASFKDNSKPGSLGRSCRNCLPVLDAFVEPLERFAKVGFALGEDIEVVAELVHQRGKVLELVVEAADAGRWIWRAVDQAFDGVGVFVDEFDVEVDARDGIDAGFGDLVLLLFGERLALLLFARRAARRAAARRE